MGPVVILLAWAGLVIGFAIVSFVLAATIRRMRLLTDLRTRTPEDNVVLAATGRVGFGESPSRSFFLVVLLRDGLYLHGVFSSHEFVIPGPSISYVGIPEPRKGLHLANPVTIRFLNTEGKEAGFVFQTLSPAPWADAVKTQLFAR